MPLVSQAEYARLAASAVCAAVARLEPAEEGGIP